MALAEVVSVELVDVGELLELVDDSEDVVDDPTDEDNVVRVLLDDVLLASDDSVCDPSSLSSSLSSLLAPNPKSRRRKSKKGLTDWTEVSEASGPALAPDDEVEVVSVVDVALLGEVLDDVEVPEVPVVDEVGRLLDVPSSSSS